MLCGCLEPLSNSAPQKEDSGGGFGGSYPGRRNNGNFVPTGGNALAAYDPNVHGNGAGGGGQMVSVTVPPGVSPGQTLQVAAPDGSERMVQAVVPAGAMPGSTFMVQFPPAMPQPPPAMAQPFNHAGPAAVAAYNPQQSVAPEGRNPEPTAMPTAVAVPADGKVTPPPAAAEGGYGDVAVLPPPAMPPPAPAPTPAAAPVAPPGQKLILVQVPPGTSPGTPLHVQVPGENRTVKATVPPGNVKEFHVAYQPSAQAAPTAQPPTQQQPAGAPTASPSTLPTPAAPPGQKLILVKVPPGSAPGTTLHVQVPGENRVLAATIPPGNVQEFHVAYTPQQQQGVGNMPPHSQMQQQRPANGYGGGYNNNGYNPNNANGNNNQNQGGGMMGSVAPVVAGAAGAALMGAAAYSMFHHGSGGGEQGGENMQYADDNAANGTYAESAQEQYEEQPPAEYDESPADYDGDGGDMDFGGADY